jgi:hypothetical protein
LVCPSPSSWPRVRSSAPHLMRLTSPGPGRTTH